MKMRKFSVKVGALSAVGAAVVMTYFDLWPSLGVAGTIGFGFLLLLLAMSESGLSWSRSDV